MTFPEQCAILFGAAELELLQPEDVARWADGVIIAMDKPPAWIIELSTLDSPHLVDYTSLLEKLAPPSPPLSLHRRIQMVVMAHEAGHYTFSITIQQLFRVAIIERNEDVRDECGRRLEDALSEWDKTEDLDVIEPPLREKFNSLFREYLSSADEIAAVLPWVFKQED